MSLLVSEAVRPDSVEAGACPGLPSYTSQPHATEESIRRRCGLLREIEGDGRIGPPSLRDRVLDELSNRFAIEIDFAGTVEMRGRAVDYLLGNMPETAVLVSAYSENEYRATQMDETSRQPGRFFVTNEETFAAGFTYLFSRISPDASEHMFFETGRARVLFWTVWGSSFVEYSLEKHDDGISHYDIKIHVFTDSRLLATVLKSRLFRYFARAMFDGIVNDIESAVREFAGDPDPDVKLPLYFVSGLKRRLRGDDASIGFLVQ